MRRLSGWLAVFYLWRARRHRREASKWLAREREALARSEFEVKRQCKFFLRARLSMTKAEECEKRARHARPESK